MLVCEISRLVCEASPDMLIHDGCARRVSVGVHGGGEDEKERDWV